MAEVNDGGQAFPISDASGPIQHGLTIRDWFAGQVLAAVVNAMLQNEDATAGFEDRADKLKSSIAEATAQFAYESADAMIKRRTTSGR